MNIKRSLLSTLASILLLTSASLAATPAAAASTAPVYKWGVGLVITGYYLQPILEVNIDDKYDLVAGYGTQAMGAGNDQSFGLLLGGTMWTYKTGPVDFGWSAYLNIRTRMGMGDSTSDNTVTRIDMGFSAKTKIMPNIYIKGDALLFGIVSGKSVGFDTGGPEIAPIGQLSLIFNFM